MSETVIHVEGLGKRYRVGERERYLALRDVLTRAITRSISAQRRRRRSIDYLWALRDVSFDVRARRGGRADRTERRRKDNTPEDSLAHHAPDGRTMPKSAGAWEACSKSAPVFIPS